MARLGCEHLHSISLMSAEQSVWIAEQRFVRNNQESVLDFTYYRILSEPLFFSVEQPCIIKYAKKKRTTLWPFLLKIRPYQPQ